MTIPIKLYKPLYELKAIAEDIWIVDGPAIEMSFGIGKVPFSTRMTVVCLSDGKLWLHSPIRPETKLIESLNQLGQVAYLIGPNKLHYAYIQDWKDIYPDAEVWLAPGIVQRAKEQKIPLPEGQKLTEQAPEFWKVVLDQELFQGSRFMQEAIFYHKKSQTLILTDMIENIETQQMKPYQKLLYKIGDNAYPNGKTPRDLRMSFLGRKKEAHASFQQILSWNPQNIILASRPMFPRKWSGRAEKSI